LTAQPTTAPSTTKRRYPYYSRKPCAGCGQIIQRKGDLCADCQKAQDEADKLKGFACAPVCGACGVPLPKSYAGRHKHMRLCTACMPPNNTGSVSMCDQCPHIVKCWLFVQMRGPAMCEWPDRHDLLYLAGKVAEGTAPITVLNIAGVDREAVLWALEKYGIEA
jgi:hypothetical protein